MGSTEKTNEKKEKKSVDLPVITLQETVPKIVHQSLEGVRKDIQNLQEASKDLQLMMRGLYAEIREMKEATQGIERTIGSLLDKKVIKKAVKPPVREISTGLDLLTQIPQHLRRTFETILKLEKGATALKVSLQTGKSRPLESDYLNQLVERGFVIKKHAGKKVLFYGKFGEINGEEDMADSDPDGSIDFITMKKMEVINASNSSDKKIVHIETLEE